MQYLNRIVSIRLPFYRIDKKVHQTIVCGIPMENIQEKNQ